MVACKLHQGGHQMARFKLLECTRRKSATNTDSDCTHVGLDWPLFLPEDISCAWWT